MPVYEYKCQDCGHVSEALRPMSDADVAIACEACDSDQTERAHSVFNAATSQTTGSPPPGGDCSQCASGGACPYSQ